MSWASSSEETYDGEHGAQVMILGAGRATLELSNRPQIDLIDTVEVGRTGVSGKYRLAFEVDDSASVTNQADCRRRRAHRSPDRDAVALAQRTTAGSGRRATDDLHRARCDRELRE